MGENHRNTDESANAALLEVDITELDLSSEVFQGSALGVIAKEVTQELNGDRVHTKHSSHSSHKVHGTMSW